jgi:lipopolysaccharide/colanic/teichoic acid biosynthesis glycosyltransferase
MPRLFKVSIPGNVVALVISDAILILCCYTLAAYGTVDVAADLFLIDDNGIWHIVVLTLVLLLGIYFHDLYENFRIRSRTVIIQQFCMILGIAFLFQALANYGRWSAVLLPKWVMVYGSLLVLVVLPSWRILFTTFVWKAMGAQRILFLGSSPAVREIAAHLSERAELGYSAIGYLEDATVAPGPSDGAPGPSDGAPGPLDGAPGALDGAPNALDGPPRALDGAPRLGAIEDLDVVVATQLPDRIVVGMAERRGRMPVLRLLELRYSGILIEDAATMYEAVFGRVSTRDLRPSQLIFSAELGPGRSSMNLQALYSFGISVIGIAVTLPVMIAVALIVRFTSPGPALFRQRRVGLNGAVFTVYKFRSMYADSEKGTGAVWAKKDDPRVTPVGRWLRKLRLDELPQLFNVLRGEMSIVGPRPERPEFVAVLQEKIPYYRQRHCVKPGITGWAQINHKYGDTIEDAIVKLEYDLYYIKNLALSLDAYITFHTAKTMLFGRGSQ